MSERLFPERQRCKDCGKGLGASGAAVFLGLFCSPRCAKMASPVEDAARAPRECRTERDGLWVFKRRYRSMSEIPVKIREDPTTSEYWCTNHCGALHIGHSRIDLTREAFRMLADERQLADMLIKLRGKATRKDVAAVAGIRPIRLKELEEPGTVERVDLTALFKVLGVYRVRAGVAMRS